MIDILFLTLPRLELRAPITAPAILKSAVENHGFTAYCYDLNIDLWHKLDEKIFGNKWLETDLTFRYEDKFNEFWDDHISSFTKDWLNVIKEKNPKWIGITVFSQRNKWMTIAMCKLIRKHFPTIKIILGGPFVIYLGEPMLNHNLIDFYVIGEGEIAIIDILAGRIDAPGVNGNPAEQIADLSIIPIPNYDDFDLTQYSLSWYDPTSKDNLGSNSVYITGSRGCIRRCAFCDIKDMWPKYRHRSGKDIAAEILNQHQKYNSVNFLFTDSLLNGNVPQLKELCAELIQCKAAGILTDDILLQGQFAARSEKDMPEEIYAMMSKAGMRSVSIGVESGSEAVRNHMHKNSTDIDLEFTFKMCQKYNINMTWLLMVGYVNETELDFQKTLQMLDTYVYLAEQGIVQSIALGPTLDIVPGSWLHDNVNTLGITYDTQGHWIYNDNTREVRIKRWLRLKDHCVALGYNIVEKATDHLLAELKQIEETK